MHWPNPHNRSEPLAYVLECWRSLRPGRVWLDEVHRLGGDIDSLARDVNSPPSDLRAVAAKWPGHADLLRR
jgi:hypothetical protein